MAESSFSNFTNKTVVVTGGAGALGRGVVEWFTERDATVAILDVSDDVLSSAYPSPNPKHTYIACDLTDRQSSAEAIAKVISEHDRIDVLVNVAGGFLMGDPVHETNDDTWDFLFNLNTRSILNMSAAVVPQMLASDGGKIVNIAARAALAGVANMGAYTASKAAVMRLTESMAAELREKNINVNAVMPSLIDSPRNRTDMPDADFSRWVTPAQLASVIGFLCSAEASAVHGACIPVDGLS